MIESETTPATLQPTSDAPIQTADAGLLTAWMIHLYTSASVAASARVNDPLGGVMSAIVSDATATIDLCTATFQRSLPAVDCQSIPHENNLQFESWWQAHAQSLEDTATRCFSAGVSKWGDPAVERRASSAIVSSDGSGDPITAPPDFLGNLLSKFAVGLEKCFSESKELVRNAINQLQLCGNISTEERVAEEVISAHEHKVGGRHGRKCILPGLFGGLGGSRWQTYCKQATQCREQRTRVLTICGIECPATTKWQPIPGSCVARDVECRDVDVC